MFMKLYKIHLKIFLKVEKYFIEMNYRGLIYTGHEVTYRSLIKNKIFKRFTAFIRLKVTIIYFHGRPVCATKLMFSSTCRYM